MHKPTDSTMVQLPLGELAPSPQEEAKLLRRLQMMMNLVIQTIAQDGSLTIDEASQMRGRRRFRCFPARTWLTI
jgi:hypothetical protein